MRVVEVTARLDLAYFGAKLRSKSQVWLTPIFLQLLHRERFGTYGKTAKTKGRRLDKVWVFGEQHSLGPIKKRQFQVLQERHALFALTSGSAVDRELVRSVSLESALQQSRRRLTDTSQDALRRG